LYVCRQTHLAAYPKAARVAL